MSRRAKIITAAVVSPLLLILLLIGGAFLFLQTDSGRGLLTSQIEGAASDPAGLTVELGTLEGNIFGDFTLSDVRLSDPKGEWLTIGQIAASWSPFDLLAGRLTLNAITAETLSVARNPELPPAEEENEPSTGLPKLPIAIRLSKFAIENIHLAEPVIGQSADLQLLLNLNAEIDDVIHSEIRLTERDDKSRLLGTVDFHPVEETLAIDINLEEPEGGLISRLLALPGYPAIRVNMVGDGLLNAWRGQLEAGAGKLFDADFAIATKGDEKIALDLNGGASLDAALAKDIPLVDDSRISIDAALSYDRGNSDIVLSGLNVENAALRAGLSGSANPDRQTLDLRFTTNLRDTAEVNELIAPARLASGDITLDLKGTFEKMVASLLLNLGGLEVEDSLTAREVTGTFTSDLDLAELTDIPVRGSAALVGIDNLPAEAAKLVGETLDVDFDLLYGVDSETVTLNSLRLLAAHLGASGSGAVNVSSLETTADLSLTLDDLGQALPMGGRLIADLHVSGPDISKEMAGTLNAHVENFDFRDPALQPLVGAAPTLDARFALKEERLSLSDILLKIASGQVAGTATLPMTFETLNADFTATLPRLAALNALAGVTLGGDATLATRFSGALTDPDIAGKLIGNRLKVNDMPLGRLVTDFNLAALATSPAGEVAATLTHDQLSADLRTKIALPDYARLDLTALTLREQDNLLSGDLRVPFDGAPMTGEFTGSIPDLASFAALAGQDMSGIVDLTARLQDRGGAQAIDATVTGKSVNLAGGSVGITDITATAAITDAFANPAIDATATARKIIAGGQKIQELTAEVDGGLAALDYRFDLTRGEEPDLTLTGSGEVQLEEAETRIRLTALDGNFAERPLRLTEPLSLRLAGETMELASFGLSLGEGNIRGNARLTPTEAAAGLDIAALPLDLLELVSPDLALDGALNGAVKLAATKGAPATGTVVLTVSDIRFDGEEYGELPTFASAVNAELKDGELTFNADITGLEATSIKASGSLPFDIALDPAAVLLDDNKPVKASLNIDSDVNKIWPLLALDTQVLRGLLKADFTVAGTINAPRLEGQATLRDGYFEETEQGTILKNLTLDADLADGETLTINLSANDTQGGTLKTSGSIGFETLTNPAVDLKIALARLQLVNRDDIMVISDGDIAIKGAALDLDVTGDITTQEVELNIGGSVAPSVVDLDYQAVNKPGAPVNGAAEPQEPSKIALDLALNMPARVFIRGRGLDSEWQGNFTITGTASTPRIEGKLKPVRGQFTFAGKAFVLQEGEISLLGGDTINPELALSAQYVGANVTAIVSITGTATNPKISFTSPDGLPQDEVLAQVLFGKSSGKLTAIEAVQLAETVATISGKLGSGGGITGFVRDTLGVDVVSARTNEQTGEAEVSVGKYVTDNIYVGVDQGAQSGTRAKVQIELTPNISVESEMGQSTDSSVGIVWKWDY